MRAGSTAPILRVSARRRGKRWEPLAQFRLYPSPSSRLYALVHVWPTYEALEEHRRRSGHHPLGGVASCTGMERWRVAADGSHRKDGIFAEVNFHRGRLGMEIVTHELFHATIAYGRRIGFDWTRLDAEDSVNADEERITYAHGRLCSQFVTRAERFGLYDAARWEAPARRRAA